MSKNGKEREIISDIELIKLKHSGSSDSVRIPAHWRRSFPQLKGPLIFEVHIEKDGFGKIFIVFEKSKQSPKEVNEK